MGKRKYFRCRGCGEAWDKVKLNPRGYCRKCSMKRLELAMWQMMKKKGEYYERWKDSMKFYANGLEKKGR